MVYIEANRSKSKQIEANMSCGIYMITNTINSKRYIGQSINIERRWAQHKCSKETYPLYRAFRKHGLDKFSFEILLECKIDELNKYECAFIAEYVSNGPNGYNTNIGGSGSPKEKSKLATALKNKDLSDVLWQMLEREINGEEKEKLGSTALGIIIKSLADLQKGKGPSLMAQDLINQTETEEWSEK